MKTTKITLILFAFSLNSCSGVENTKIITIDTHDDINVANFTLGRESVGGEAIALLSIDVAATDLVVKSLKETLLFQQVQPLSFIVN